MAKNKITKHSEVIRKKGVLDKINAQLKSEFIGLDNVIDEITDAVSAWYIFPDIQDRPVVVNLWGLTGVGKTSLVKRLSELLGFQNSFYRFDMGEASDNEWAIRSQLRDVYDYRNGKPMILVFDEFQNAKTKDHLGVEINNAATRIIWDLLDAGKFHATRYLRGIDSLMDLIKDQILCMKMGVKVKDGIVIDNREAFVSVMKLETNPLFIQLAANNDEKRYLFVQESYRDRIYEWIKTKYEHRTDFEKELNSLNVKETMEFLYEVYENSYAPVEVDCSKGLLFVMGNLDEAYTMSNDFNPNMRADDFHKDSLRINVTTIKKVLRKRFRNEQIARLGNIHVIYPTFTSQSYKQIIDMELKKVSKTLWNIQQLRSEYHESLKELIYNEGVYPTQGTRPLFTTIHQIIKSKLSKIVCFRELNCREATKVIIAYVDDSICFRFYKAGKFLDEFSEKLKLNLEVLRKETRNDNQAIVAVHESGHALVSSLLERKLPERIFSTTADSNSGGFVYISREARFTSRKDICKRLATLLGGYVAEMVVFGEENITFGSENDIETATRFVNSAVKYSGMGTLPMQFSNPDKCTTLNVCFSNELVEEEAKEMIKAALVLAKNLLTENKLLLLKLSNYLSDNRCLEKEGLRKMILEHTDLKDDYFIEGEEDLFYRNHLKKSLENFPEISVALTPSNLPAFEFSLNKVKEDVNDSK